MEKKIPSFGKKGFSQTGQLYEPGEVILTDSEKKALEIAGWKKGDPLPGKEFSKAVRAATEKMEEDYRKELDAVTKSGKAPIKFQPKNIEDLPLAKQKELREIIEKTKEGFEEQGIKEALAPPVFEAIKGLREDGKKKEEVKPESKTTVVEEAKVEQLKKEPTQAVDITGTTSDTKTHCQHCGWDLSVAEDKIERNDAFLFVQSILSGKSFIKEYPLLGGKLKIAFRTLPIDASDMCLRQCALEAADGTVRTQDEFFTKLLNYRLTVGLEYVMVNDVEHSISAGVDDYLRENKEELGKTTPLPMLLQNLRTIAPLDQEPVWRLIGKNYQRFNSLVSGLEAKADDSDFYQAIVAPL